MAEKPILFSRPMVRAILAGTKTQTRRVVKNDWQMLPLENADYQREAIANAPYQPGDTLWVRETWCPVNDEDTGGARWVDYRATPRYSAEHPAGWHEAPGDAEALKWKASMFMPRWASRITLEVTDVRCQRVQDISEEDAVAEGVMATEFWTPDLVRPARAAFRKLWDSINAKRGHGWDSNPWVWAYTFELVQQRPERSAR